MGHLRNFEVSVFRRVRRDPPTGKIHRIAFWLFLVYLVCLIAELLPGDAGLFFRAIDDITLLLLIIFCAPLLWRWLLGSVLWRVRNRLIVTYLLMGLAPVVLFVALALILLYVFSGQFAIFAANDVLEMERAHISSENRVFAIHSAHILAEDPKATSVDLPEFDDSVPNLQHNGISYAAFENGRALRFSPENLSDASINQLPSWIHGRFGNLVIDNNKLYLRAVDTQSIGGRSVTTITSLPLAKTNVDQIARGLGAVTITPDLLAEEDETAGKQQSASRQPRVTVGLKPQRSDMEELGDEERSHSIRGGTVPAAQHFYDLPVTFAAPLETLDWQTGKLIPTYATVHSRPSLLYQRLFITSLRTAAMWQDALIVIAVFFGFLELFAFFLAVRLNRTITQSVRDLYHGTQAIDHGDFSHRIRVTRNDQLAALSRSFNSMTASLARLLVEARERAHAERAFDCTGECGVFCEARSTCRCWSCMGRVIRRARSAETTMTFSFSEMSGLALPSVTSAERVSPQRC